MSIKMMSLVLARIKISHFNLNGMEWSFQSFRNGMTTPFLPEWSVTPLIILRNMQPVLGANTFPGSHF